MSKCKACLKHVNITERIKLCSCVGVYHNKCLNIITRFYKANTHQYEISWQCPECQDIMKRQKNDNTPVRNPNLSTQNTTDMGLNLSLFELKCQNLNLSLNEFEKLLDTKLKTVQKSILTEITEKIENKILLELNNFKEEIKEDVNKFKNDQKKINENISKDISILNNKVENIQKEKNHLENQINEISNNYLKNNTISQSENSYRQNKIIVLYGLNEMYDEDENNIYYRVLNIFEDLYNMDFSGYIKNIYRIGKKGTCRPIKIELLSKRIINVILNNIFYLKNTGLYISEYFTKDKLKDQMKMKELLIIARKEGKHAVIRNKKLFIDGKIQELKGNNNSFHSFSEQRQ